MTGQKDRSFAPLPPVSLDELVPTDHCPRHLERSPDIGIGFAHEITRKTQAVDVVPRDEVLQRDGDRLVEAAEFGRAKHPGIPLRTNTRDDSVRSTRVARVRHASDGGPP